MWRIVLSLLLIGSTLIGQSVCCCTFRALNASTGFAHTPDAGACCCSESSHSDQDCPLGSNDSDHKCPCKKGQVVSARLGDNDNLVPVQFSDWSRSFDYDVSVARLLPTPVITPAVTYFGPSAFPHLDGAGILRAVNCMRC